MVNEALKNGYFVYKNFIPLKLHFTGENFDYFTFKSNSKTSVDKFISRTDYKIFVTIGKVIDKKYIVPFLVSQFISYNNLSNISQIVKDFKKSETYYMKWVDRINNLKYNYKKDMYTIAKKTNGNWKKVFSIESKFDYPMIFKMVNSDEISKETYTCMNDLFNQTEKKIDNDLDLMYNSYNLKYKKYRNFLNISTDEIIKMTPIDLSVLL